MSNDVINGAIIIVGVVSGVFGFIKGFEIYTDGRLKRLRDRNIDDATLVKLIEEAGVYRKKCTEDIDHLKERLDKVEKVAFDERKELYEAIEKLRGHVFELGNTLINSVKNK